MTPWVWPAMHLNPPNWIQPITDACEAGRSSCFTTGIDPGFANDLFPMTLMGLCSRGPHGAGVGTARLHQLRG